MDKESPIKYAWVKVMKNFGKEIHIKIVLELWILSVYMNLRFYVDGNVDL